ncbi:hypothetical protein ACXZ1M_24380 [Duganella sp. PWIR1]
MKLNQTQTQKLLKFAALLMAFGFLSSSFISISEANQAFKTSQQVKAKSFSQGVTR